MLSFNIPTKAKLISVNTRSESHGPDLVPAIDLRFQMDVGNAVLAQYDPDLLESFYKEDAQGQLPGIGGTSNVTALRFPKMAQPLHWNDESLGNTLTVDYGIEGESFVELADCKVHKHVIHAKEGGTCTVAFTCSCAHDLTEQCVGRLGTRVQHDLHILLRASPMDANAEENISENQPVAA